MPLSSAAFVYAVIFALFTPLFFFDYFVAYRRRQRRLRYVDYADADYECWGHY